MSLAGTAEKRKHWKTRQVILEVMLLAPLRGAHHSLSRCHTAALTRKKEMELLCFLLPSDINPLWNWEKKMPTPAKIAYLCWFPFLRQRFSYGSYLLWVDERLEKAALVRPANHSRLSCMLAKAFRSLTSLRISCWGMSLSPRLPMRTSDSLPKAALKCKPKPPSEIQRRTARGRHELHCGEGQTSQCRTVPAWGLKNVWWSFWSLVTVNNTSVSGSFFSILLPAFTISEFHVIPRSYKRHPNQLSHLFAPPSVYTLLRHAGAFRVTLGYV